MEIHSDISSGNIKGLFKEKSFRHYFVRLYTLYSETRTHTGCIS
ncbi:hypothetical protein Vsou_20920 [Vulcanisaeta souniana JCM 11219]|uniref:Uncharacterized protein n=1 Tax=Vulcanisaeta souniana JCM 11219 TaxID=1293586 RepID=A0ABN6STE6_9CREN|nr:hypothetical protein Vsou_20920 [Vulcanisaeta souniana JCM 11219]